MFELPVFSQHSLEGMLTGNLLRKYESGLFGAAPKLFCGAFVLERSHLVKEKMAVVGL